jgi:DNA-binding IscR family transcriptional regulator
MLAQLCERSEVVQQILRGYAKTPSLGHASGEEINSTLIAGSVNTSSSFVRRGLAKLSRAGLVETPTGKNGACWLAPPPRDISHF